MRFQKKILCICLLATCSSNIFAATSGELEKATAEKNRIELAYSENLNKPASPQPNQNQQKSTQPQVLTVQTETLQKSLASWEGELGIQKPSSSQVYALGFRANDNQIESINNKYKYNVDALSQIPADIANMKMLPNIKITNGKLHVFDNQENEAKAKEYLIYHPLHGKVFYNYLRRIITLDDGVNKEGTLGQAIANELTYNFALTPIQSSSDLNKASEQYLYILTRLTEEDQAHFWSWMNLVRNKNTVSVPSWVRIADILNQ